MFSWKEFKEGKLAVHCDTAEKANDFLKKCENQGLKWPGDIKPTTVNCYGRYQKETCYYCFFSDGKLGFLQEFFMKVKELKQ